jgi:hypothetical protein
MSPADGLPFIEDAVAQDLDRRLDQNETSMPGRELVPQRREEPQDRDDDDRFDWSDEENVVCHEQPRSAVYFNPRGQVVIRQQADYHAFDEDSFVFFSIENVPALIEALRVCIASNTPRPPSRVASPVTPGASRQKRYRERHRDGGITTPERDVTA